MNNEHKKADVSRSRPMACSSAILYNEKGTIAYFKQGKIKIDILRQELEKLAAQVQPQK